VRSLNLEFISHTNIEITQIDDQRLFNHFSRPLYFTLEDYLIVKYVCAAVSSFFSILVLLFVHLRKMNFVRAHFLLRNMSTRMDVLPWATFLLVSLSKIASRSYNQFPRNQ
jgi:hypothetical protein